MRARLTLLLLPSLLIPAAARASVVVPLGLADLVDRAERIAVARVESQVARWTSDHDAIYTDVTLRVLQPVKGVQAGEAIVVRREGGEVDGIGMKVWGAASFQVGEQVLIFLERRGVALWTVGMAQGKMHVTEAGGRKLAIRQNGGLAFLPGRPVPKEPAARPLDELVGEITVRVRSGR